MAQRNTHYNSLSDELMERIREDREKHRENPYACKDEDIIRRYDKHDIPKFWRPAFVMDVEKILHNNYYNRYSDKTQVISCYKNDDISRRALHVQLVSRIARTIGMTLGLNLDLIEAISLGHDIGHTPFGHAGERFLNDLYQEHTGRLFNHNVHSVRVLDKLICRNISLQVLDGVLCHNGEMEQQEYRPKQFTACEKKDSAQYKTSAWNAFDTAVEACYTDPEANKHQVPGTLEGCVMRISDIIAYLGKDRQDAAKVGLVDKNIHFSSNNIGSTNAEIINNMTVSIIEHSYGKPYISMDADAYEAFSTAKKENYAEIYKNSRLNQMYNNIQPMFHALYEELLQQAKEMNHNSVLYRHHINYIRTANVAGSYFNVNEYIEKYMSLDPNEIVTDFIASMTDDYFIDLYHYLFPSGKYHVDYVDYFSV